MIFLRSIEQFSQQDVLSFFRARSRHLFSIRSFFCFFFLIHLFFPLYRNFFRLLPTSPPPPVPSDSIQLKYNEAKVSLSQPFSFPGSFIFFYCKRVIYELSGLFMSRKNDSYGDRPGILRAHRP